ncbi:unnamed protein product [Chrysodeixis includens]|uniref:Uncharacterized protein n=1 Tax=Chrysodeixis includens TaxID=689277 RepID=A0A9P0BUL9_CHRIL|nr:unnamed protein product [Chrysodeixis includens]
MLDLILYTILVAISFKIYQIISHKPYTGNETMKDKVVIVTGSNTGIGLATATDLAGRGAKVILACRNEEKTKQAMNKIKKTNKDANLVFKPLDLASFKSVREFATDILKTESRLDVLINNAGTGTLDNSLTEDNLPVEAQVNHFGPFLLTMLLLPLIKSSAPSRIVNVSSLMHRYGNVKNLDKQGTNFFDRRRVYSDSKLANVLFTRKLSEQLKGTGVTVNCLHPGAVSTDIFRNQPTIVKCLLKMLFWTPAEGAQTTIYLSVAKELQEVSGKYFNNCTETTPAKNALDDATAEELWKMSEKVTFLEKKTF